jgi:hypothetical protein
LAVVEVMVLYWELQDQIRVYFLLHHFLHIGQQVVVMVRALMIVLAQVMVVVLAVRVVVQEVEVISRIMQAVLEMLVDIAPQRAITVAELDFLDKVAVEVLEVLA